VLVSTLKRARQLITRDELKFRMRDSVFEKMLMGEEVSTQEYLQIDDTDLTFHLKQWEHEADSTLSDLARRFIDRKLFKAMDMSLTGEARGKFWSRAEQIVRRAGYEPEFYLIMDRAGDVPYYGYYSPVDVDPGSLIYIESDGAQGEIREISEVSEAVRGLRGYSIDRVCFPAEVMDELTALFRECNDEARASNAL
jgi:HD superfamily phosphohydrolase